MDNEERVSPMGMWRWGKDFFESAVKIQPTPNSKIEQLNQNVSIVAYYLLGHGIELQLKSFLLGKDFKIGDLRSYNKFGHNLEELIEESFKNGICDFIEITEHEKSLIFLLNETYKEKELEYFLSGYKLLPNYLELIKLALKISDGLSSHIHGLGEKGVTK